MSSEGKPLKGPLATKRVVCPPGKKRRQQCQQILYQNTVLIDGILLLRTFNNVCFKDRIHAVKILEKKQKKIAAIVGFCT